MSTANTNTSNASKTDSREASGLNPAQLQKEEISRQTLAGNSGEQSHSMDRKNNTPRNARHPPSADAAGNKSTPGRVVKWTTNAKPTALENNKGDQEPNNKPGSGNVRRKSEQPDTDYDRNDFHVTAGVKRLYNPNRDNPQNFHQQQLQGADPTGRLLRDEQNRQKGTNPPIPNHPRPATIVPRTSIEPVNESDKRERAADDSLPSAEPYENEERLRIVLQPETRPISSDQLIAEVKGIYAGLIMVEAKCCEVDAKQHQQALVQDDPKSSLNNEQWQALIALHRTLLHEHHDFFLASQHPSASAALKKLAQKYSMPARMWRHGIHSFLELLRHRLPHSLEHMLTFIYLAYSMMALLYETVPAFEDTWIECLGDLGRYRMAIEDDDVRDREIWQNCAKFWYSKAADKTPNVGRLYHHLAILARPDILKQFFFYCKSLAVVSPFHSARESILTVFDPLFNPEVFQSKRPTMDSTFIQIHAIMFTHINFEKFDLLVADLTKLVQHNIEHPEDKWRVQTFYLAICNITALYDYGAKNSILRNAWKNGYKNDKSKDIASDHGDTTGETSVNTLLPPFAQNERPAGVEKTEDNENAEVTTLQQIFFDAAKNLGFTVLSLILEGDNKDHTMPHILSWMVFLTHIMKYEQSRRFIETDMPWDILVRSLNVMRTAYAGKGGVASRIVSDGIMEPEDGECTLPEEYELRGMDWAQEYFESYEFFKTEKAKKDEETRIKEYELMEKVRLERILWLAVRLSKIKDTILYDTETESFSVSPELAARVQKKPKPKNAVEEAAMDDNKEVVMTDEEGYVMVARNPENKFGYQSSVSQDDIANAPSQVRELKEKEARLLSARQEHSAIVTKEALAHVSKATALKGAESLDARYTAFVIDTNLLISHLETFNLITSQKWPVIIPNSVITELNGLGNNTGSVGDSAKSARITINRMITEGKDIRIFTSRNTDVTKAPGYKEKLSQADDFDIQNLDDVIIQTAKAQANSRRQMLTEQGKRLDGAEPIILLTEDANMRLKASGLGIPAISTTTLKHHLAAFAGQKKNTTPPRPKRKSTTPNTVRVYNDDDRFVDEIPHDGNASPYIFNTEPKKPVNHRQRTNKRGRTTDS
ncbi:Similar to Uncharacterized protein YKR096W; acc. no. P36168 [Pyronema omphalodes CBS 100304]|nr:Similar to Uncharacterized protein YKR096W; acc. no. P36168 [Pyronema omphalodes CBS 100304]